jgi:2-C-methyl-D-erythritol 4-phosphate cytidylyltransferase
MSNLSQSQGPSETIAVVVAGGAGTRMGSVTPKQFLPLQGQPLLFHSLAAFDRHAAVDALCVVIDSAFHTALREEEPWCTLANPRILAEPGEERADSVRSGLKAIQGRALFVVVHEAARPLVTAEMIDETLRQARLGRGGVTARRVTDTVKCVGEGDIVIETVDRRMLWAAQTPQAFPFDLLWRAHAHVVEKGLSVTDDAQALEALGKPVAICPATTPNPKITLPEDLISAEALLAKRLERAGP